MNGFTWHKLLQKIGVNIFVGHPVVVVLMVGCELELCTCTELGGTDVVLVLGFSIHCKNVLFSYIFQKLKMPIIGGRNMP